MDEKAVQAEFARFADAESPELMLEDGIASFCDELGIDPSDIVILVVAYHMEAAEMCVFTKDEFVRGMSKLRCVRHAHADHVRGVRALKRLPLLQGGVGERAEGEAARAARQAGRSRFLPRPCLRPQPSPFPPAAPAHEETGPWPDPATARHTPLSLTNSTVLPPFQDFYEFTFKYSREAGQKNLPREIAVALWKMLLEGRSPLLGKWINFMDVRACWAALAGAAPTADTERRWVVDARRVRGPCRTWPSLK